MAESLPLGVHGVDGATGEKALFNEALPVDLVLVFAGRELFRYLEDFD